MRTLRCLTWLLVVALLGSCARSTSSGEGRGERTLAASAAQVEFLVDPRVELLCILNRLAGAPEYEPFQTAYAKAVAAHFAGFAAHPAVARTRDLRERLGIGFATPIALAVHLDAETWQPLRPLDPLPHELEGWQGVDLPLYLAELRDFAERSGFAAFAAQHAAYYGAVAASVRHALIERRVFDWRHRVLGVVGDVRWIVSPGLLSGANSYSAVLRGDGFQERHQVVALELLDRAGVPHPTEVTAELAVHEILHSDVNPLVEAHWDELAATGSRVYALTRELMEYSSGDPEGMLMETAVRALTALYTEDARGRGEAERFVVLQQELGFFWLPEVVDRLRGTVAAPGKLGSVEGGTQAMQQLAAAMKSWSDAHPASWEIPPFRGPIYNALSAPRLKKAPLYVVAPPASGTAAAAQLRKSVRARAPDAFPGAVVLDGTDDAWARVADGSVACYGSPASNALTRTLLAEFGWRVEADQIALGGRVFRGENLVLIAARAHPRNPRLAVLVYASAEDASLVGVERVFQGPTDWVVARRAGDRFEVVGSGLFGED